MPNFGDKLKKALERGARKRGLSHERDYQIMLGFAGLNTRTPVSRLLRASVGLDATDRAIMVRELFPLKEDV